MEEKETKSLDTKEKEEVSLEKHNPKSWFKATFTGFLLGLAVILPGISGSTIAILFKLYDKILFAVSNIFKKFKICILFLLPILVGAIIGFVVGFFVVQSVIENYTFIVVSIFGGLMLGAAPEIYQVIKKEKVTPIRITLLLLGLAFPVVLSASFANVPELDISSTFESFPWWIHLVAFLIGAVISLTQIIPGLSATVLLMSIGFFKPMMGAVHLNVLLDKPQWILFFFLFAVGFACGFFALSKIMSFFFKKYHTNMYFLITGLTFGSVISVFYNKDVSNVYTSVWPTDSTKMAIDLGVGIPLFIVCTILAYLLVIYMRKRKEKETLLIDNSESISKEKIEEEKEESSK